MSKSLLAHLTSHELFRALDESLLQDLEEELELAYLPAQEMLFAEGDDGDSMYVLLRGRLKVTIRTPDGSETGVDELAPIVSVGEMALLTGQKRAATVYALEDAELVRLSKEAFERLAERHPELLERFAETILPRLQRTQLVGVLSEWLGPFDAKAIHALQRELEWVHLADGETLFHQGDAGDTMYLVVSGRLQAVQRAEDGSERVLGEIGRGEGVGEYAMLTGERRSATVHAIRDSQLVSLPSALAEEHPRVLAKIARGAIQRAQRPHAASQGSSAATFAVLPIGEAPLGTFSQRLAEVLKRSNRTLHLSSRSFDHAFGREGAAQTLPEQPLNITVTGWLNEKENDYRYIVYEADPTWTPWTRRCLRQADRILLLARGDGDPKLVELERALQDTGSKKLRELVLVQPDDLELPSGTLAWLTPRSPSAHHHVRMTHDADFFRLARRLTGRAVGLVLSGGGARGYAHIGLLRACEELGLSIDFIGGTSMGALVGGAFAFSQDARFCHNMAATFGDPKRLVDYTLPLVALTKSKGITSMLQTTFKEVQIEDLWMPFYCVSANLTRAEQSIHERGPLWRAVRASLAIPGVFTPILDKGDILVDGGVMNNFPVDIMRDKVENGVVIGSSAYSQQGRAKRYDFNDTLSGWRLLLSRLLPFGEKPEAPSIVNTLVSATAINSTYLMNTLSRMADLVVNHPTEDYGTLQFDRFDEIIELGYQEARSALRAWQQGELPPSASNPEATATAELDSV